MTGSHAGPLISVTDLAAVLASSVPTLLDVRWRLGGPPGIEAYQAGHLPGAVYVDLDTELAGPPGSGDGGRHPLPGRDVFQAAMRAAGLNDGQLAVVYDDAGSTIAARLWWLLRYFGHEQVAVLDGGLAAWSAVGRPLTTRAPEPAGGNFTAGPGGAMPVLGTEAAARTARSGFLLDARSSERYRGDVEPIDRAAGHIPGAISAPATGNVSGDGVFLPVAELSERFRGLGLPGPGGLRGGDAPAVGAYCGSGVTAAQEVLALHLTGVRAALYVGSWSAWSADPARPVATGPDPG
ncbi:MAG TPA: sulfurtransferase [Streptosporangiaceae bacterium]|nr:sulfurtransferase [Streptosporangiaceae bacterium]